MNRKILAALPVAVACVLLLAACGKHPAQPAAGTTESTSGTTVTAAESAADASETKTETAASTETAAAENTSAAPEQPSETEATRASESAEAVDIPDEARTAAAFAGVFQSGRCSVHVTAVSDTELRFEVSWSSGASDTTTWEMTGALIPDVMRVNYGDCVRKEFVDGSETVTYTDGMGRFQYADFDSFTWMDEQENAGHGMVFTRIPG